MWSDLGAALASLGLAERDAIRLWCASNPMLHYTPDGKDIIQGMYFVNVGELQFTISKFFPSTSLTDESVRKVEMDLQKAKDLCKSVITEVIPVYEKRLLHLRQQKATDDQLLAFQRNGLMGLTTTAKDLNVAAFQRWARSVREYEFRTRWRNKWVMFAIPHLPQLIPTHSAQKLEDLPADKDAAIFYVVSADSFKEKGKEPPMPHQYVYNAQVEDPLKAVSVALSSTYCCIQ